MPKRCRLGTTACGEGDSHPDVGDVPWRGRGSVNYWLLILAIVLLIVIFGAPIIYRTLDRGRNAGGLEADSPAQQAISHNQRGKISEKILKKPRPAEDTAETVGPAVAPPVEDREPPSSEEEDKGSAGESVPQPPAAQNEASVPKKEPGGEALEKQPAETDAAPVDASGDEAADASVSQTVSSKRPEAAPSSANEPQPAGESKAPAPEEAAEKAATAAAPSPDIREVIVEMGNVRDAPSIEAEVKFRIKRGDTVRVTKQQGNWCAIELDDGRSGWAHHTLLSRSEGPHENKGAPREESPLKEIRAIRPILTKADETGIIFELNGYYPPKTRVLDGDHPRLVCDFPNTRINGNIPRKMELTNGFIERIRIGIHEEPHPKVRVVMDFKPGRDYTVEQLFYKKENYYTLMVKPRK
jgi:hypothetical protein